MGGRAGAELSRLESDASRDRMRGAGKGLKDINACRSLALKLEKAYSPERWSFTTCDAAKGMPKAAKLVRDAENEAW